MDTQNKMLAKYFDDYITELSGLFFTNFEHFGAFNIHYHGFGRYVVNPQILFIFLYAGKTNTAGKNLYTRFEKALRIVKCFCDCNIIINAQLTVVSTKCK